MATRLTDLDIHITPDTDNPDGRLKDDVYSAGDPPVLLESGSDAKADYPVMDLATLGYRLIRDNGDTPNGTPDTQTSSQIYDGLINRIRSTAWDNNDFEWVGFPDGWSYLLDDDGSTMTKNNDGTNPLFTRRTARGMTYGGVYSSNQMIDVRTDWYSVEFAGLTWTSGSNGKYTCSTDFTFSNIPYSIARGPHSLKLVGFYDASSDPTPDYRKRITSLSNCEFKDTGDGLLTLDYMEGFFRGNPAALSQPQLIITHQYNAPPV